MLVPIITLGEKRCYDNPPANTRIVPVIITLGEKRCYDNFS